MSFDTESVGCSVATGFIVDAARGLILTNRHVVHQGPVTATTFKPKRLEESDATKVIARATGRCVITRVEINIKEFGKVRQTESPSTGGNLTRRNTRAPVLALPLVTAHCQLATISFDRIESGMGQHGLVGNLQPVADAFNVSEFNEDCKLTAANFARLTQGMKGLPEVPEMELWRRAGFAPSFWQERGYF